VSVDTLPRKSFKKLKGLYAITDERLISEQDFDKKVEQALLGGANIIQYRDKSNDTKKRQQQALSLCRLCEKYNALCIINDDIQLAKKVSAHGVHLGKDDASLFTARDILGEEAVVGVSCYNDLSLALSAEKNGANYVAFGAIFPSPTKPDASVAGLEIIAQAKEMLSLPICTIGGISHTNIQQVIQHGADMAAVISGIFAAGNEPDKIIKSTQNLSHYFDHHFD
jgi:thiamine-phosphate pyrophosphorylase